ncbi:hypothetical protein Mal48_14980 [Thalassoglobus polymorphus]|uniref:Uncharacterized protein n=1 Tax=Thalassoglobus polymorphus TaxID=2527994 RepID=A0A517QKT3_9PLAN|nr:hypothetical protein Mal48_14980 [Thalassoglobus polymorphus]
MGAHQPVEICRDRGLCFRAKAQSTFLCLLCFLATSIVNSDFSRKLRSARAWQSFYASMARIEETLTAELAFIDAGAH